MTLKFSFEVLGISSSGAKMSMLSRNKWCKSVNGFLVTASAAAAVNSLDLSSAEIADREKVAKEISLKLRKPLSTRLGDLVPLEGLSFGPSEQKMEGYGYRRKQSTSFVILLGLPDLMAP